MTHDAYDEARRRAQLSQTEPRNIHRIEDRTAIWLPVLLVAALLIGAGLYIFAGSSGVPEPNMRADEAAQSQPSSR
jgi:hypothetical protein